MTVDLEQIVRSAGARQASLVAETTGYLLLGAAEQVAHAPRSLSAADVLLDERGEVAVRGSGATSDAQARQCLQQLLEQLLTVSRTASAGLLRACKLGPRASVADLVSELEVALIPVNRAAGRRALSRLHKEVQRALPRLEERPAPAPPLAQAEPGEPGSDAVTDPMRVGQVAWTPSALPPLASCAATNAASDAVTTEPPAAVEPVATPTVRIEAVTTAVPAPVEPISDSPPKVVSEPASPLPPVAPVEPVPPPLAAASAVETLPLPPVRARHIPASPQGGPASDAPDFLTPRPTIGSEDTTPPLGSLLSVAASDSAGASPMRAHDPAPAPARASPASEDAEVTPRVAGALAGVASPAPPPFKPRQSDVSELLAGFVVAEERSEPDLRRDLRRIAGLDPTPMPPSGGTGSSGDRR